MFSNGRRRSSDLVRDSTSFYSGDVIKHGFLMKSPPVELFYKQSSWKRRYFLLIKLSRNAYSLQYYSSQNTFKGEIKLDAVLGVCREIKNRDKMAAVQKMFKCPPEQVISIATKQRDYYLIGDEGDQIQEWFEAIRRAMNETWKDIEQQTPREDARVRSISLPPSSSGPLISSARTSDEPEGTQVSGPRPNSDPCNYPTSTERTKSTSPGYSQYHRHNKPEESNPFEEENDSPDGGIYDIPRSILRYIYCNNEDGLATGHYSSPKCMNHINKELERHREKPDDLPDSEQSDESEDCEVKNGNKNHYMEMRSIPQLVESAYMNMDNATKSSCSQDSLVSPVECNTDSEVGSPESFYDSISACSLGSDESSTCEEGHGTEASPLKQRCSIERRNCKKRRSTPSLPRLFSSEDPSLFTEENISLPKEDLLTYMELVEVGERICVAQWNGPEHMTCPFRFGDHILAVNEIGIQSKEEVIRSLTMARSEKVTITIVRVPNSDVLHAEGSGCP
ncbi:hypothetical protein NDU88_006695 [Pleurodeles waltl]|uniref:PH domain-containing protein n=1 Tax=Pleurodeles waltl TaxID=8319 RepID=A0AAV7QPN6_PLEWA|nr:hypothetical protein NDU88_006695 [Pleurodeles waltl]